MAGRIPHEIVSSTKSQRWPMAVVLSASVYAVWLVWLAYVAWVNVSAGNQ